MAQQMPNTIELYEAAAQGFRQTLSGVKPDQMTNSTPCTLWNVQSLINHNIKVAGFVFGALTENITVNPMEVAGRLPAEGAMEALDAGVAKVLELIKQEGSVTMQIGTPFGRMTRGEFLMATVMDLTIHKWDLARGTDQNTTLDGGLLQAIHAGFSPQMEGLRQMDFGGPIFAPEVTVPATGSLQDRVLGMVGRQP